MNQSFYKVSWSLIVAVISFFFMIGGAKAQVPTRCSYEDGGPYTLSIDGVNDLYCVAIMTCDINGRTQSGNIGVCKALSNKSLNPCPEALACALAKDPTIHVPEPDPNNTHRSNASTNINDNSPVIENFHIAGNNFCIGVNNKQTGQKKLIFCRNPARSAGGFCHKIPPNICAIKTSTNSGFHFGFQISPAISSPTQVSAPATNSRDPGNDSDIEGMPWLNEEKEGSKPADPRDTTTTIKFRSRIGFR